MYRYLGFSLIAGASTAMASTLSNRLLINKIPNEYYLSREIPGQIISLGLGLVLAHRYKANPLRLGIITSWLFPVGVMADVMASRSDNPIPYLTVASVLRNISYVGPAGCHTASIVQICKTANSNIFGTRNMVMGSLGATFGIFSGVYINSNVYNPVVVACIYPIALFMGWKVIR